MTHTNHRMTLQHKNIKDFILLAMPAKGINDKHSTDKLKSIFKIIMDHSPINGGGIGIGNLISSSSFEIIESINPDTPMIHGVFTTEEQLISALTEIKEKDYGISIVATGNFQKINELAAEISLKPHSVAFSLDIFGNKNLLPSQDILEITTMCGHGLISSKLAEKVLSEYRNGEILIQDAVNELGRHCVCGIFNTERAKKILASLA